MGNQLCFPPVSSTWLSEQLQSHPRGKLKSERKGWSRSQHTHGNEPGAALLARTAGSSHGVMAPAVQRQVVRARKTPVAVCAPEGLDACVLAEVASELIGASKFPGAAVPGAFVRLLSYKGGGADGKIKTRGVREVRTRKR